METTVATDGSDVLDMLVSKPKDFLATTFGRHAVLSRNVAAGLLVDLASAAYIEHIISSGLRAPSLRIVKDGQTLPADRYTRSCDGDPEGSDGIVDTDAVLRALTAGHTVVVRALHRLDRQFALMAARLRREIGEPIRIFAYLTPPGNQGLRMHYDTHDVFAVQCEGTKNWTYAPGEMSDPLPAQAWHLIGAAQRRTAVNGCTDPTDVSLDRGDVLYLPRGFLHSARSSAEFSVHLAVSVHPVTVHDVLDQVTRIAMRDAWWRGRAAEVRPDALRERTLAALTQILTGADMDELLERARTATEPELPPPALDVIRQYRLSRGDDVPPVAVRPGARISVRTVAGRFEVRLGDARIVIPDEVDATVVEQLARGDAHGLEAMRTEHPKIHAELVRALATVGVIVPVG